MSFGRDERGEDEGDDCRRQEQGVGSGLEMMTVEVVERGVDIVLLWASTAFCALVFKLGFFSVLSLILVPRSWLLPFHLVLSTTDGKR